MIAESQKKNTEVKAFARYIHVSPRKLRLVADLVRKLAVDQALQQLRFSPKNAALPLAKAINSAVANAVHNFNLNKEDLFVQSITIDGGPVFKRYAPRAQGRAFVERKRTSHINVVLIERARKGKATKRNIFSGITATPGKSAAPVEVKGEVENNKPTVKQAGKSDENFWNPRAGKHLCRSRFRRRMDNF